MTKHKIIMPLAPGDEALPAIASGDAGKALVVNQSETGAEWSDVGGSEADIETVNYVLYEKLTDAQIDKLKKGKLCVTYSYGQTLIHHFYEYEDGNYFYLTGCQYFWQSNGVYVPKKCKTNYYVIQVSKTSKSMMLGAQYDLSTIADDSSNFFDAAVAPTSSGKKLVRELNVYNKLLPAFAAGDAGKALTVNSTEDGVEWSTVGGGSAEFVEEITHAALKTKKDNSELVPGKWYRITDYEFAPKSGSYSGMRSGGHPFDILVFAISTNTLSEDARACKHAGDTYFTNNNAHLEAWRLKYHFDNSDNFCDFSPTSCKGVIYYLEDEWGNAAGYDFKNLTLNYFYTFDLATSGSHQDASTVLFYRVYNNKIDIYYASLQMKYGSNIFKMTSSSDYCYHNYVSGQSTNNTIGKNCYRLKMEGSCYQNQIGDENQDITFRNCSYIDLSGVTKARKILFDGNNSYLTFAATGSSSDYLQNVHVHFGVQGESGSPKTVTIARGLAYETNVISNGTTDLTV